MILRDSRPLWIFAQPFTPTRACEPWERPRAYPCREEIPN